MLWKRGKWWQWYLIVLLVIFVVGSWAGFFQLMGLAPDPEEALAVILPIPLALTATLIYALWRMFRS